VRRPSDRALAKARRAAGKGKPLSDYLIEDKA
jgi:hypothetical protein